MVDIAIPIKERLDDGIQEQSSLNADKASKMETAIPIEKKLDDGIQKQSSSYANANQGVEVDITIPMDGCLQEQSPSNTDEAKGLAGVKQRTWIVGGAAIVVFLIIVLLSALLAGKHKSSTQSSLDQQRTPTLFSSSSQPPSLMPSRQPPSSMPSPPPTVYPTLRPTATAGVSPTPLPSDLPSMLASVHPSTVPTAFPSSTPSFSSSDPSYHQPTSGPTVGPSPGPTPGPTVGPSSGPSSGPSAGPSSGAVGITADPTYAGISTFFAIGDVPYNVEDAVRLEEQMLNIAEDARFVIHVGDLRSASDRLNCTQSDYSDVASILRLSRAPVFVIIGDNDWNDCPNREEGKQFWQDEFISFDTKYWNHTFQVVRQPERTENFAFVDQGTLFIGLNIVGGFVHDQNEWETRLTDEVEWTMDLIREYNPTDRVGSVVIFGHAEPGQHHNSFFAPLTEFIANELQNQLPILYLNGDKHAWNYEPSFFGQPSFLRITVTGGTSEPPLKVSAATGQSSVEEVFTYDRQLG